MTTSYNTYIGARYVPIIVGEWDNTREYEPLMIVTYQGNSYTSKTYVPTDIAITNTEYWVCTGDYNAQVAAYRQEVQQLYDQFGTLESELRNEINELIENTEQTIATDIADFNTNVTNTYNTYSANVTNTYNTYSSNVSDTYDQYVEDMNTTFANYGNVPDEIADIVNVYGAKNLITYPYEYDSRTISGITFTVNSDGSITTNGTATDNITFRILTNLNDILEYNSNYKLSGSIGGAYGQYGLGVFINNSRYYSFDGEVSFTTTSTIETTSYIYITVASGCTLDNITFSPMIRCASITDDTYQPYAMTNAELTEQIAECKNLITESEDLITLYEGDTSDSITDQLAGARDAIIDNLTEINRVGVHKLVLMSSEPSLNVVSDSTPIIYRLIIRNHANNFTFENVQMSGTSASSISLYSHTIVLNATTDGNTSYKSRQCTFGETPSINNNYHDCTEYATSQKIKLCLAK